SACGQLGQVAGWRTYGGAARGLGGKVAANTAAATEQGSRRSDGSADGDSAYCCINTISGSVTGGKGNAPAARSLEIFRTRLGRRQAGGTNRRNGRAAIFPMAKRGTDADDLPSGR